MTALKTARDVFPKGTPAADCIAHNRLIKSIEMALAIRIEFGDQATPAMLDRLTEADFARAARAAGVEPPNSDETRNLVRLLATVFEVTTRPGADLKGSLIEALLTGPARRRDPPAPGVALDTRVHPHPPPRGRRRAPGRPRTAPVQGSPSGMPLRSTANHLLAIAAAALQDLDGIDSTTADAIAVSGLATITFASSGDPAVDRRATERINLGLRSATDLPELGLLLPVIVRPQEDHAALRAASDALRDLAHQLDRAAADGAQRRESSGLDRAAAVACAEHILSSYR
ncbi:hypothetical protein [Streptomyces yangpuensis]|uniref:hypothetical protein n=1 Tax=Streptomyces yangpuensis TaxID=1648182 RepID=UPI003668DBF8